MAAKKSITKNYNTECIKKKKYEQIQIRINKRKLVLYPTIQLVVILYTKYELSILYSCGDIFDKKCGEKEKRTYTRKKKTGECWFSIPRCNKSLSIYIENINLLS